MTELATDAFRTVGPGDAIPNDFVVPYYLDDRKVRISVARVDGRLYAFDDLCTCTDQACPLSGGLLTGTTIMCQCHGSRFDIATGAVINGPATEALNLYEVQEVEGSFKSEPDRWPARGKRLSGDAERKGRGAALFLDDPAPAMTSSAPSWFATGSPAFRSRGRRRRQGVRVQERGPRPPLRPRRPDEGQRTPSGGREADRRGLHRSHVPLSQRKPARQHRPDRRSRTRCRQRVRARRDMRFERASRRFGQFEPVRRDSRRGCRPDLGKGRARARRSCCSAGDTTPTWLNGTGGLSRLLADAIRFVTSLAMYRRFSGRRPCSSRIVSTRSVALVEASAAIRPFGEVAFLVERLIQAAMERGLQTRDGRWPGDGRSASCERSSHPQHRRDAVCRGRGRRVRIPPLREPGRAAARDAPALPRQPGQLGPDAHRRARRRARGDPGRLPRRRLLQRRVEPHDRRRRPGR